MLFAETSTMGNYVSHTLTTYFPPTLAQRTLTSICYRLPKLQPLFRYDPCSCPQILRFVFVVVDY